MDIGWIIFFIFAFIFFVASGIVTFIILNRLRWNYQWILLEELPNGKSQISKKGRARLMSFGDGGEEIFFLKNLKRWRVAYGKRIAKNQVAWGLGQDGYWYNVDFGAIDKRLQEAGVYPVDRDMRYAYASARKGIANRYDKKNFMDKYGTLIAFGMLGLCILAMCVFAWLNYNGQQKLATINNEGLTTSKAVMDEAANVLNGVANLKTGGSGTVTVTPK